MSRPSDLISTCEVAALVLVVGVELHEVSSLVLWLHGPTFRDDIHGHTPPYAPHALGCGGRGGAQRRGA